MKDTNEGVLARTGERLRRAGAAIRRHPVKTAAALPLAVVLYVLALVPFTPGIGDIKKVKQEQPSVVLSSDGKELAVFKRANRDWVKLADISPKVTEALLATEDKRFYEHPGIDFVRTAKAAVNTFRGEREGGSTLTQQLARNLYPEQIGRAPTLTRKIKEAITAIKIEAVYSKDEILETYLNSVSFLYNAWGIEMASRTYFDKPAKNLNELEAATLVGMLKGTAYYNPVLNPERALQRRNTVLAMMVKEDKLPEARFEQLKAQPLKLDFERIQEVNGPMPHLAEYLRRWLFEWADQHDYNVYADGLVIKTTIDSRLQQAANQAVERQMKQLQAVADVEWARSGVTGLGSDPAAYLRARAGVQPFEYFWSSNRDLVRTFIRESAEYKAARDSGQTEAQALHQLEQDSTFMAALKKQKTMLQTGFMAIEPATGAVRAWVGSRDYSDDKFDHVNQARRQPGSTFKPFVYGAAFEAGHQPTETLMDQPVAIQIDKNQVWRPGDIEGGPSNQPMTLRDGLAKSKNTITAQLMMQVGPSRVASLARAMGVRQSKLQEVPSLALGTSPVTLKEMVTAFSSIANSGNYIEPQIITAVEDRDHNVLDQFLPKSAERAMSNEAAMTLLDVMRGVIDSGTAVGLKPRFGISGDLAGKTGTTQDNTDGWFIVMHPQLVAGAWVGFNDNRVTMRSSYWGQGAHNALLVVGDFLQQSQKANIIDAKAVFAAPRMSAQEKPLMDRMGDWWNSVFNSAPGSTDTAVVASPEIRLDPPVLDPSPRSLNMPTVITVPGPAVTADAPVIVDASPQRVPSFPRPLEAARPAETISGTQVYRPDSSTRDGSSGGTGSQVVRVIPSTPAVVAPSASGTSSMGAGGGFSSGSAGVRVDSGSGSASSGFVNVPSASALTGGAASSRREAMDTGSSSAGASIVSSGGSPSAAPIGDASGSPAAPAQ
jgi:penicillin-binding protein 1A